MCTGTICLKNIFTAAFEMVLCGECYEKGLRLKACKLSTVQGAERWIIHTPLSVNFLVTLDTE
jgi:hypothetical protein